MPHVSNDRDVGGGSSGGGGGDDLCSSDEIKVFKEEDGEDEKRSTCDRVNEDKCDLIDLSESDVSDFSVYFVFFFFYYFLFKTKYFIKTYIVVIWD